MVGAVDVVTGGAGFIGAHLVRRLLETRARVRVLDDFSSGRREKLAVLSREYGAQLEINEVDIRDLESLRGCMAGAGTVYHQAAIASVPDSIRDPVRTNATNVSGSLNVLTAAREVGARKVVLASSCAVYGNADGSLPAEGSPPPPAEGRPPRPASPYAISKLVAEFYAENFGDIYDLPTYCLRYYNVFGPEQDPGSEYAAVIPRFITRILAGERPVIYGDGEQTRDFIFVDDIVSANLLAARADARGMAADIGCGRQTNLNELVEMLGELVGRRIEPVYEAARAGEVRHSCAAVGRAQQSIGFRAELSFFEGLRRTVDWYREQRSA